MNPDTPASEVIRIRTSRRSYLSGQIPEKVMMSIEEIIQNIQAGPFGTPIGFSLVSLDDSSNRKLKLGTYGFVQGARLFLAGKMVPSKEAFLDYGFVLEKLILEFTRMGLGTCWLGGTFDRSEFAKAIQLGEGQVIPAITPVGFATATRGLGERIIRMGAGSKNRLPWDQLFFNEKPDNPFVMTFDNPVGKILEAVRLAPSASNKQPWRIIVKDGRFDFYISRKPGYQKPNIPADLQMIDMGIAMAHFDLVAREISKNPVWKNTSLPSPTHEWDYVISVLLQT